jgi:hypothetical protein
MFPYDYFRLSNWRFLWLKEVVVERVEEEEIAVAAGVRQAIRGLAATGLALLVIRLVEVAGIVHRKGNSPFGGIKTQ